MSVRTNILSVLTLAPAYGLQVHSEIETRTGRPGSINVGQIYSTLNRLIDAGLVVTASRTDDRLPLYDLTSAGRVEAGVWLGAAPSETPVWADMVAHVMLAASLPGVELRPLIAGYRAAWLRVPDRGSATAQDATGLILAADGLLAAAAVEWLTAVSAQYEAGALRPSGLSTLRPKRGRRPATPIRP